MFNKSVRVQYLSHSHSDPSSHQFSIVYPLREFWQFYILQTVLLSDNTLVESFLPADTLCFSYLKLRNILFTLFCYLSQNQILLKMASIVHYPAAVEFASSQWKSVSTRAHYTMNEDGVPILTDERLTPPAPAIEEHRQVEQQQQLLLSAPLVISSSSAGQKRKFQMEDGVGDVQNKKLRSSNNKRMLNLADDKLAPVSNSNLRKKQRLLVDSDASPSTSSSWRVEQEIIEPLIDNDNKDIVETDSFGAALRMADSTINSIRKNKAAAAASNFSRNESDIPVVTRPKALNQKPILVKLVHHANSDSFYRQDNIKESNLALRKQMLYTQLANAKALEQKERVISIEAEIRGVNEESKKRFLFEAEKLSFQQMQFVSENLEQNKARKKTTKRRKKTGNKRNKNERSRIKRRNLINSTSSVAGENRPNPFHFKMFEMFRCSTSLFKKKSRKYAFEKQLKEDYKWFGGWQKVEYFPDHFMWMKKTRDSLKKCRSIWQTKGAL